MDAARRQVLETAGAAFALPISDGQLEASAASSEPWRTLSRPLDRLAVLLRIQCRIEM